MLIYLKEFNLQAKKIRQPSFHAKKSTFGFVRQPHRWGHPDMGRNILSLLIRQINRLITPHKRFSDVWSNFLRSAVFFCSRFIIDLVFIIKSRSERAAVLSAPGFSGCCSHTRQDWVQVNMPWGRIPRYYPCSSQAIPWRWSNDEPFMLSIIRKTFLPAALFSRFMYVIRRPLSLVQIQIPYLAGMLPGNANAFGNRLIRDALLAKSG